MEKIKTFVFLQFSNLKKSHEEQSREKDQWRNGFNFITFVHSYSMQCATVWSPIWVRHDSDSQCLVALVFVVDVQTDLPSLARPTNTLASRQRKSKTVTCYITGLHSMIWIDESTTVMAPCLWLRLLHRALRNRNLYSTSDDMCLSLSHICTTYDQFFLCDPPHFEIMKIESNIRHVVWLLDLCLLRSSSVVLVIPHFPNSVVIENGSTLSLQK